MSENNRLTTLMNKARYDLMRYIERREGQTEEADLETPVYFAELENCQTPAEVYKYMERFGWKPMMSRLKRQLRREILLSGTTICR